MSKIKNLAMQSAFTNICGGKMGHSEELSEFKCGTVIGCHLYHKSVHEMSSLLEIPRSTVNGTVGKLTHSRS